MERKGVEPSTTALRTYESTVLTENLSEVPSAHSTVCTSVCTSEPEKRRTMGSDAASDAPTEGTPMKPDEDFAAALAMLATLPLSYDERADAVLRLLGRNELAK